MKTILVIDDDEQIRKMLDKFLSSKGFQVICAENGVQGLEKLFQDNIDLVMTDIVMPDAEGVEVILAIRETDRELPVIAMSGGNFGNAESYLGMAGKLGANAVLRKPFALEDVVKKITLLLTQ